MQNNTLFAASRVEHENTSGHRKVSAITPALLYHNATAKMEWLCKAFGFEKKAVVKGHDDTIVQAHLTFENGAVMLASVETYPFPELCKSPQQLGGVATGQIIVFVKDVDSHYQRAIDAGAQIVIDLEDDPHGGRVYSCRDPGGYLWVFSSYDPWT